MTLMLNLLTNLNTACLKLTGTFSNKPNEGANSTKFLGVLLNVNINWKDHMHAAENKIAKSSGLFFRVRNSLNQIFLKSVPFACIHPKISYANIALTSAHIAKLK